MGQKSMPFSLFHDRVYNMEDMLLPRQQ
jgi:hypothetical protein